MIGTIVKFNIDVGEIPKESLGILLKGAIGDIDYSRIFIPNRYVGLPESIIPCYTIQKNGDWRYMEDIDTTDAEKKELSDLEKKIFKRERLFIAPNGILVNISGGL